MDVVIVDKEKLLFKLRENREEHYGIVVEAQEKYREAVIKELDKMLSRARNGKKLITHVSLMAPMNMTNEYDAAIEMLEMHEEPKIKLTRQQFDSYVKDNWHWKQSFTASNALYVDKLKGYNDEGLD